MSRNCWEFMGCPPDRMKECIAYPDFGSYCWLATGTYCQKHSKSGELSDKTEKCLSCPWFVQEVGEHPELQEHQNGTACWEFWQCKAEKDCPAYPDKGAYCWIAAETYCQNNARGRFDSTYPKGLDACRKCLWRVYRAQHPHSGQVASS